MFAVGVMIVVGFFIFSQKGFDKSIQNKVATESGVPLPLEKDVIRVFFSLIDGGRVSEAVMMMSPEIIKNDTEKQSWGVMWNAFEEMKVTSIEPAGSNVYKVVLETKMKPGSEKIMPMPYYGYGDGEFTRWVETEKIDGVWKIKGVATGP
jgi:hypothetical protein